MTHTALFTTTLVIVLGIYDLVMILIGPGASLTVSRFLINIGFQAPAVVFMVGFVCGHVWGYAKPVKSSDD